MDAFKLPMDVRAYASTFLATLLIGGLFPAVLWGPMASDSPGTRDTSRVQTGPKEQVGPKEQLGSEEASGGVAVVELFTSEGCSSCPPADRLLRTLVKEARSGQKPLFALSFHVDYWNDLGWEDPYSAPEYTRRQRSYAEALDVRVYTPQMIVNGREVLVGSREAKARSAVGEALSKPAGISPEVQLRPSAAGSSSAAGSPSVRIALPQALSNAELQVALVERGLSQSVSRGENAGRTLRHANVVRAFKTVPARRKQVVSLKAPSDLDPERASIIAYVQDLESKAVLGAARADLDASSR